MGVITNTINEHAQSLTILKDKELIPDSKMNIKLDKYTGMINNLSNSTSILSLIFVFSQANISPLFKAPSLIIEQGLQALLSLSMISLSDQ